MGKRTKKPKDRKKVDKNIFTDYADFECDRNVFLNLSVVAGDWGKQQQWRAREELKPRLRRPVSNNLIVERGKRYEQEVYKELRAYGLRYLERYDKKIIHVAVSKQDTVYRSLLTSDDLKNIMRKIPDEEILLLEHEFELTRSFTQLFADLPVSPSRPDIISIRPLDNLGNNILHLNRLGEFTTSPREELTANYGISIIDIKSIPEDRVTHKYYNEVLYYLQTFNYFIQDHKLSDFVILAEGNGIFPTLENLKIYDFIDMRDQIVDIDIEQVMILYENTVELITDLTEKITIDRKKVQQTFGAHCDKCNYLDDCLVNSGYDQENNTWEDQVDIEVLPNVNNSIISQLKQDNISTVEALYQELDRLNQSDYPQPIQSILPILDHKTKAINDRSITYANADEIYSTSIPKYTRTKVTFTLETDSTTDLAFAFGIMLETSMSITSNAKIKELYSKWWRRWKEYLDKNKSYNKDAVEELFRKYQSIGFLDIAISNIKQFAKHLHFFQDTTVGDKKSMRFILPGDKLENGKISRKTQLEISYVNISLDITKEAEKVFLLQVITVVARIIQMTLILESSIQVDDSNPDTAFYYWSNEIVEKMEELLEKHMGTIINDPDLYNRLFMISQWISPSNQVTDPNQLKRIFDLSKFVDSVMGMPLPINYTWHRAASLLLKNFGYNYNYWSPLFNNMDRSHWHTFIALRDTDQVESNKKYKEIQGQIYSKIRTMGYLVNHFQFNDLTRPLISSNYGNKPQEVKTRATDVLPPAYHPLAKNWYLFAILTESVDELEKIELRSTYPQEAVGKLEAAKVTNLTRRQLQSGKSMSYIYSFELTGLSRNVKFSEGDQVLLIPIAIRDSVSTKAEWDWRITISTMSWDNSTSTYHMTTEERRKDVFSIAEEHNVMYDETEWYIYPTSGGYWANKLYRRNSSKSLLKRNGLGSSILGQRVAMMWDIGPMNQLPPLQAMKFPAAQVYMFAPDCIEQINYDRPDRLLTQTEFPPDDSQEEAIFFALESPLRLILGPPGTGKSQTIVALIDEFLRRRHNAGIRENRILITSFAYTASNVLLEKICSAVDTSGNPNLAAKAQKVFIMSNHRSLPQLGGSGSTYNVDRLAKRGAGWDFNNERITPKASDKLEQFIDGDVIFFGNAHQVYKLDDTKDDIRILSHDRLEFDLIIVDEASQLPTDHMLSIYQHVRSNDIQMAWDFNYQGGMINPVEVEKMEIMNPEALQTHVVLVGDDNQLPPVQPIKPPENLKVQLGSVFDYYKNGFDMDYRQLQYNYRSHELIVDFTASLDIYDRLIASPVSPNRDRLIPGDFNNVPQEWTRSILDPHKVVVSLVHDNQFDTSVSLFEANISVQIILDYFRMINPKDEDEEVAFWYEAIGIVAPHNAHSRTIINMLFQELNNQNLTNLVGDNLMTALKDTIFSVEKFQGSERDLIIGTVGVSAKDQLRAEEDFIYDLNRINVLTTRAKSKMILVCSKNFLEHIPKDRDRFFDISILKKYTYKYCDEKINLDLPDDMEEDTIEFYWKLI